jgi:hypothetical protein
VLSASADQPSDTDLFAGLDVEARSHDKAGDDPAEAVPLDAAAEQGHGEADESGF